MRRLLNALFPGSTVRRLAFSPDARGLWCVDFDDGQKKPLLVLVLERSPSRADVERLAQWRDHANYPEGRLIVPPNVSVPQEVLELIVQMDVSMSTFDAGRAPASSGSR